MEQAKSTKKQGFFYGYWVLMAVFLCVFLSSGFTFYNFSLFVRPIQDEFGWSRTEIMLATTIYFLVVGLTSPFVGRLVERFGARKVIATGALGVGLTFMMISQTRSLPYFYVSWAIFGMAAAGIGVLPASSIISYWFKKRRGLAIGIMGVGVGAGSVLAPVIGGYLIPNFGWRVTYMVEAAAAVIVIVPLALFVIRTKPADMGLYPDGAESAEASAVTKTSHQATVELSLSKAIATSSFWLIAVCFLFWSASQLGTTQSQVPHLQDIGFPVAVAAGALGVLGLGSATGKFAFGWLCDLIPPKYACATGLGLQVIAITILLSIGPTSPAVLIWAYALTMGLGMGSWVPTMSMLISSNFGLASYASIFGVITLAQSIGNSIGPLVAGRIYDTTNSYHTAFIIFLTLYAIAIPSVLLVRRPKISKVE